MTKQRNKHQTRKANGWEGRETTAGVTPTQPNHHIHRHRHPQHHHHHHHQHHQRCRGAGSGTRGTGGKSGSVSRLQGSRPNRRKYRKISRSRKNEMWPGCLPDSRQPTIILSYIVCCLHINPFFVPNDISSTPSVRPDSSSYEYVERCKLCGHRLKQRKTKQNNGELKYMN